MLKLFGIRKTEASPEQLAPSSSETSQDDPIDSMMVHHCRCCGTLVKFPSSITKYRCSVCSTTLSLAARTNIPSVEPIVLSVLREKVEKGLKAHNLGVRSHSAFSDLENYISEKFGSVDALNNSFLACNHPNLTVISINYDEVKATFRLISSLSSKRPYLKLLSTVCALLRRPRKLIASTQDVRWLLILFELPTLADCLYHSRHRPLGQKNSPLDTPEVKAFSYEVISRIIGYLASSDRETLALLTSWFSSYTVSRFKAKVELINLYITFHLTRIIYRHHSLPSSDKKAPQSPPVGPTFEEYSESCKLNPASPASHSSQSLSMSSATSRPASTCINLPASMSQGLGSFGDWTRTLSGSGNKNDKIKLKVYQYGNDWHIRTAARLMSVFYTANKGKVSHDTFYNTLSDYLLVKQDFEVWQSAFKNTPRSNEVRIYQDILSFGSISGVMAAKNLQFTFCQFPFLLTLGCKIAMLEYEARRSMEKKAEEAFIKALDQHSVVDLNLKVFVRRTHITNDSLRCIKNHQGDLKKVLKVEFAGEPGIDAGGLKKEWFQLLTRELFSQNAGMFFYNDESHLCWFSPAPLEGNDELYYLVGVILGLAIYNSTILDLKFPVALYKKLMGKKVTFEDYNQLFPSTGKGLSTLLVSKDSIEDMGIYFETTFINLLGEPVVKELIPGGSDVLVTNDNRREYIERWVDYYMNKSVERQFKSFYNGFHNIIGGNALSLFSPREIELVICGNNESKIDTESFKAITKYSGWGKVGPEVMTIEIVQWFWEWFGKLNYDRQAKFLVFVTGSDRIPATGVSTMTFKMTKLTDYSGSGGRLPCAHTCFNELCLYDYSSKRQFWDKMDMAITESEGYFGIR
ncbi:putative E3 ubiquitin-protein ligase HUL4 [Cyberlindnera fabianii]|uniref:HECT-type E3 ubiquitin transferase n=2 Tax=Cyberlindnera fabianii TaxID=36022 RepID=A0A1V2LDU8_CYBFA|nr:putative E3 ubiquitin-protein ligase HUL4 [Cyberlindnera fabianii]